MALTSTPPRGTGPHREGDGGAAPPEESRHLTSPLLLTLVLLTAVMFQDPVRRALAAPVTQSWMTVFVAVVLQALPFLVLGVLLSAAIAVFVPPSFFARALPDRTGWPYRSRVRRARCSPAASARPSRWRARWCAGEWPRRRP